MLLLLLHTLSVWGQELPVSTRTEVLALPQFKLGNTVVKLTLNRPSGWKLRTDTQPFLLEPEPNPEDLGILLWVVRRGESRAVEVESAENMAALLGQLSVEAVELSQEPVTSRSPTTLVLLKGQFSSGHLARFLVLHRVTEKVVLIAIAGAADASFSRYHPLFRDVLLSIDLP